MPNETVQYKCPACTGPLHFVGSSGKLECDYCGSSYTLEEIEAMQRGSTKEAIEAFLAEARAMGEGRLSVVFTGAGTSDYVGDTCAPYLRHAGNTDLYDFKPIATTDIVSAPRDFLRAEDPTLVVSFARSGNSPESLAAVAVAKELVHNVKFLNITCAPEGKLAVESADDPNALTLLIPRANDKGFAMTGSYTCMTLLSTLIFDTASDEQKAEWVETIAKMGEEVISREPEIADYLAGDFNRVTADEVEKLMSGDGTGRVQR